MARLQIEAPFIGLNTRIDPSLIEHNEAVEALNVVLDRGTIRKRAGYATRSAPAGMTDYGGSTVKIVDYVLEDGTELILYISKAVAGRMHMETGGVYTHLSMAAGSYVSGTVMPQTVVYNSKVYIVNGSKFYVVGAKLPDASPPVYHIYTNSLPALPTSGGSALVTAAGNLDGEYNYKCTLWSDMWGSESISTETATNRTTTATQQQIDISFTSGELTAAETDGRASHVKIYRKKVSASETEWFLVSKHTIDEVQAGVPIPAEGGTLHVVRDNVGDDEVSDVDIAPFSVEYEFNDTTDDDHVGLRCIETHSTVMFAAAGDSRLFFSKPDSPGILADYINIGGSESTSPITAIKSHGGQLFVFTANDIWSVTGLLKNQFNIKKKVSGTGCSIPGSVVETDQGLFFWCHDAIYAFDGNRVNKISDPIEDKLTDRFTEDDDEVWGGWDPEQDCVFWTFSLTDTNDRPTIVFNYKNSSGAQRPSWTTWQFKKTGGSARLLSSYARVQDPAANALGHKVLYGFTDGHVGTRDLSLATDDGPSGPVAIDTKWVTGNIGGDAPGFEKKWGTMDIHIAEESGGGDNLNVTATVGAFSTAFTGLSLTEPVITRRIRLMGPELKLTIQHNATASIFELLSIAVEVRKAGRKS